jgi:hypothetical protein
MIALLAQNVLSIATELTLKADKSPQFLPGLLAACDAAGSATHSTFADLLLHVACWLAQFGHQRYAKEAIPWKSDTTNPPKDLFKDKMGGSGGSMREALVYAFRESACDPSFHSSFRWRTGVLLWTSIVITSVCLHSPTPLPQLQAQRTPLVCHVKDRLFVVGSSR